MKFLPSSSRRLFAAVLLGVLAHVSLAHATVVVPLTRTELVQRADRVVRATVGAQRFMWNEDHTQILTLTTVQVRETWVGAPVSTLTVRQFGGAVDGLVSAIPGDGHLVPGQDVVLFLRQGTDVVYLTALAQSVYVVDSSRGAPTVARDMSDLSFAARDANNVVRLVAPVADAAETLAHLRADVVRLARGAR